MAALAGIPRRPERKRSPEKPGPAAKSLAGLLLKVCNLAAGCAQGSNKGSTKGLYSG